MLTPKEASRIFPYISIDPITNCWNWTRQLHEGYGRIYFRGRPWQVHRVLYLWKFEELPEYDFSGEFVLDHICNNRSCCNPDHLQVTNNKNNVLKGNGITAINARKKLCKRGHKLSPRKGGGRQCWTCKRNPESKRVKREYDKKYREKHRHLLSS